jgi:hypothetical protein
MYGACTSGLDEFVGSVRICNGVSADLVKMVADLMKMATNVVRMPANVVGMPTNVVEMMSYLDKSA